MRDWDFFKFPTTTPKPVKGGIKAQSKRGAFASNWWAKRWIAVLESFHIGARLERGRTYARRGQVSDIIIDKGVVAARVQGSQRKPYTVAIKVKTLPAAAWSKVIKALSGQALFAAQLLAGEMPQDVEAVFTQAGLSLFPGKLKDLETQCSCPDWSNPCKHIAAVFYLLGEEFDRDPFLIFNLRGLSRDEVLQQLGGGKGKGLAPAPAQAEAAPAPEPLPAEVPLFYDGRDWPENPWGEVRLPPTPAALPQRLGNFPFWRSSLSFLDTMRFLYHDAGHFGLQVFLGEGQPPD